MPCTETGTFTHCLSDCGYDTGQCHAQHRCTQPKHCLDITENQQEDRGPYLPADINEESDTKDVHGPPDSMADDDDDVNGVHAVADDLWVRPTSQLRMRVYNKRTHVANFVQ